MHYLDRNNRAFEPKRLALLMNNRPMNNRANIDTPDKIAESLSLVSPWVVNSPLSQGLFGAH